MPGSICVRGLLPNSSKQFANNASVKPGTGGGLPFQSSIEVPGLELELEACGVGVELVGKGKFLRVLSEWIVMVRHSSTPYIERGRNPHATVTYCR